MRIDSVNREWDHEGDLYKIGQTTAPQMRQRAIRSLFGERADIIALSKVGDRYAAEKKIHTKFADHVCSNPLGINDLSVREYFLFDDYTLNKAILYMWGLPKYFPYKGR